MYITALASLQYPSMASRKWRALRARVTIVTPQDTATGPVGDFLTHGFEKLLVNRYTG